MTIEEKQAEVEALVFAALDKLKKADGLLCELYADKQASINELDAIYNLILLIKEFLNI